MARSEVQQADQTVASSNKITRRTGVLGLVLGAGLLVFSTVLIYAFVFSEEGQTLPIASVIGIGLGLFVIASSVGLARAAVGLRGGDDPAVVIVSALGTKVVPLPDIAYVDAQRPSIWKPYPSLVTCAGKHIPIRAYGGYRKSLSHEAQNLAHTVGLPLAADAPRPESGAVPTSTEDDPVSTPTSAIAAFGLAILSVVLIGLLPLSIIAAVASVGLSLKTLKATRPMKSHSSGRGLSVAALAIGCLVILVYAALVVVAVLAY